MLENNYAPGNPPLSPEILEDIAAIVMPKRNPAITTGLDLMEMDTSASPMLWEGLLPANEIAMLAGVGGLGKSTVARTLSVAVSNHETEIFGQALHVKHGRVIYVSCEDGKKKTGRILKQMGANMGEGLMFIWGGEHSLSEILTLIEEEIARGGPVDLIVIDSVGNLLEGEQNSNSDAQEFFRHWTKFESDATLLFLHHISKSGHDKAPDQRHIQGAGAFVQRSRAVLMLTGNKLRTERYLHMEKENDVSETFKYEALVLDFGRDTRRYSSTGKRIPLDSIGTSENVSKVDWLRLFGDELRLPTGKLVSLVQQVYHVAERTAKDWVSGLQREGHGICLRPTPA